MHSTLMPVNALLKISLSLICLLSTAFVNADMSTSADYAVVLNLSGKQRMLTQKMSKEFLLLACGHDVETNQLNLLETYDLFERTLNGLYDGDEVLGLPGTQSQPIRAQLDVVKGLWTKFKPIMESASNGNAIDPETITNVANVNLPLLKEMNNL